MFKSKTKSFISLLILGLVFCLAAPVYASNTNETIQATAKETLDTKSAAGTAVRQQVSSPINDLTGTHTDGTTLKPLSILYETEPNDTMSLANSITLGTTVQGSFSNKYDHDYYSIYVPQDADIILEGQAYQESLSDYFCLFLKNSAGSMVAYTYNDMFSDGTHCQYLATHISRGTYYIHAQTYDNNTNTYSSQMSGQIYRLYMNIDSSSTVSVSSVSLNRTSVNINTGSTVQLSATVSPSNATNQTLTWSSSDPSVATVNSNGLVTGVSAGTANIVASACNGVASPPCSVTVTSPHNYDLTPYTPRGWGAPLVVTKNIGQLYTDASVTPDDELYVSYAYENSGTTAIPNSLIQTSIYVDNTLTLTRYYQGTIPTNSYNYANDKSIGKLSAGTHTIKMVLDSSNAVTESNESNNEYSVTVNVSAPNIQPTSVSLNKTSTSLTTGATEQLTATVYPSNATNQTLTWSSSNPSVATVSSSGLVTAVSAGTTNIIAMASNGVTSYPPCTVTVTQTNVPVTSVTLNKSSYSLTSGQTVQLNATVSPSNATDQTLTWSSSNPSIATVGSNGQVTGVAAGTAYIMATASDGVASYPPCTVTVTQAPVPVTSVTLNNTSCTLASGQTVQLNATVSPSNATDQTLTWSSSNPSIATVSSNGLVTGVSSGTAYILATASDGVANYPPCTVTVTSSSGIPVTSITLDKTSVSLSKGNTAQLNAAISPSNATDQTLTWTSSNTQIASVTSSGVVTGVSAGTTTVYATSSNGVTSGNCTVTVTNTQVPSGKTIPPGSVVFDRPGTKTDMALSLTYANYPTNQSEIVGYIVEGSKVYIKTFAGKFIDNQTGKEVDKSLIPAVLYKNEMGETYTVSAEDGAVTNSSLIATIRSATLGSVVNISLTEAAKNLYPTAVLYQCFKSDGTTAISAVTALGSDATVYPAMSVGNSIIVKLYATDGTQVGDVQTATLVDSAPLITASVQGAAFGSIVNVSLTNKGKTQYSNAVQFQVYSNDGSSALSACADLGNSTTVYPAVSAGYSVVIKLYGADGNQIGEGIMVQLGS